MCQNVHGSNDPNIIEATLNINTSSHCHLQPNQPTSPHRHFNPPYQPLPTTMANLEDQIKGLQAIIAKTSPISIACWTAIQQAQSLEKNGVGYTLFKLMVHLPIDHPTALLIPYRKNGLPCLEIFSDVRQPRGTLSSTYPKTCCTSAVSWRRPGITYQNKHWWNLVSTTSTFMGGTWSIWPMTIQCTL